MARDEYWVRLALDPDRLWTAPVGASGHEDGTCASAVAAEPGRLDWVAPIPLSAVVAMEVDDRTHAEDLRMLTRDVPNRLLPAAPVTVNRRASVPLPCEAIRGTGWRLPVELDEIQGAMSAAVWAAWDALPEDRARRDAVLSAMAGDGEALSPTAPWLRAPWLALDGPRPRKPWLAQEFETRPSPERALWSNAPHVLRHNSPARVAVEQLTRRMVSADETWSGREWGAWARAVLRPDGPGLAVAVALLQDDLDGLGHFARAWGRGGISLEPGSPWADAVLGAAVLIGWRNGFASTPVRLRGGARRREAVARLAMAAAWDQRGEPPAPVGGASARPRGTAEPMTPPRPAPSPLDRGSPAP